MVLKIADEKLVYWGAALSGAAGLIYEIVWATALANTIGGSTYATSTVLAAFMAGLAIGGFFGGRIIDRQTGPLQIFAYLQLGIGFFGAATLPIMNRLEHIYSRLFYSLDYSFIDFSVGQMILVFLVMLLPTTLMGATMPVLLKLRLTSLGDIGLTAGKIYSVNTWGAVIGALISGLALLPLFGLQWANVTAVGLNLAVGAVVLLSLGVYSLAWLPAPILFGAVLLGLVKNPQGLTFTYGVADHFPTRQIFYEQKKVFSSVFDKDSVYGRVQVLKSRGLTLVVGGRFEGGTSADMTNQKLLAYLPLAAHPNPESLLNIGLGTGTTLQVARRNPRLKRLDNVEINPAVYEAVEARFYPDLFNDRRVRPIYDDARHYLTLTRKKYDVIISEPSYPTSKVQSHLFTREFYEIARKRLKDGGVFVQWIPAYLFSRPDMDAAAKTVMTVFPNAYAFNSFTQDVIILGVKSDLPLEPQKIIEKVDALQDPALRQWGFVAGPSELQARLVDSTVYVNTDDLPKIEFIAGRNKIERQLWPDNRK